MWSLETVFLCEYVKNIFHIFYPFLGQFHIFWSFHIFTTYFGKIWWKTPYFHPIQPFFNVFLWKKISNYQIFSKYVFSKYIFFKSFPSIFKFLVSKFFAKYILLFFQNLSKIITCNFLLTLTSYVLQRLFNFQKNLQK